MTEQQIFENNRYVKLAYDYCKELCSMTGETMPRVMDLNTRYISYVFEDGIVVKKLYKDSEFVGFVIFEKIPNDIPYMDWFIMESYVEPKYRRQGIMSKGVKDFISDHKIKTIGYVTLPQNNTADRYWRNFFIGLGFNVERKDEYFKQFDDCRGYIAKCD